jgi:hypothetical protein
MTSHNDDLILINKREIDASNSISGFRDALFTNSPSRAVFSSDVVDEELNVTHGSFPVMFFHLVFISKCKQIAF